MAIVMLMVVLLRRQSGRIVGDVGDVVVVLVVVLVQRI